MEDPIETRVVVSRERTSSQVVEIHHNDVTKGVVQPIISSPERIEVQRVVDLVKRAMGADEETSVLSHEVVVITKTKIKPIGATANKMETLEGKEESEGEPEEKRRTLEEKAFDLHSPGATDDIEDQQSTTSSQVAQDGREMNENVTAAMMTSPEGRMNSSLGVARDSHHSRNDYWNAPSLGGSRFTPSPSVSRSSAASPLMRILEEGNPSRAKSPSVSSLDSKPSPSPSDTLPTFTPIRPLSLTALEAMNPPSEYSFARSLASLPSLATTAAKSTSTVTCKPVYEDKARSGGNDSGEEEKTDPLAQGVHDKAGPSMTAKEDDSYRIKVKDSLLGGKEKDFQKVEATEQITKKDSESKGVIAKTSSSAVTKESISVMAGMAMITMLFFAWARQILLRTPGLNIQRGMDSDVKEFAFWVVLTLSLSVLFVAPVRSSPEGRSSSKM